MSTKDITVRLAQKRDYQFEVQFGAAVPPLLADEPPPLGQGAGPSPVQLLAAAVGNCLSDSLHFALRKFNKQQMQPMQCEVTAQVGRNAEGRLRVLAMDVDLRLGDPADVLEHLERALTQFEAFCTVTQSVGQGITISTQVFDSHGAQLK